MRISIYQFNEASQKYQDMSKHGGDEDWVIVFHDMIDPATAWDVASPFYYLLPDGANWDKPEQQQERDYAEPWGFIRRVRDGNDLIAITAHS